MGEGIAWSGDHGWGGVGGQKICTAWTCSALLHSGTITLITSQLALSSVVTEIDLGNLFCAWPHLIVSASKCI